MREMEMPETQKRESALAEELAASESRCVVFLGREEFIDVLKRQGDPLVVCNLRGTLRNSYTYLTRYKGLVFAHRSREPIPLEGYELINAEEIRFCGRRRR
jgi:hypothetical protein